MQAVHYLTYTVKAFHLKTNSRGTESHYNQISFVLKVWMMWVAGMTGISVFSW